MSIQISAVVCTFNRAEYLRKAIHSLINQTLSEEQYEILIVDNGSTDNTKELVCGEFAEVANLRYIYEPIQGLSQARNTGWQNAKGEYIAYLDDDAIAAPQWLEKIFEVFEKVEPQPGCVGGKVVPIWEAPKPTWVPDKLLSFFTIVDYSETPVVMDLDQWIAGANIAFPKSILEQVGQFSTGLGRTGKKLLSMEENLFQEELRRRGYTCYYHPDASVSHHVPVSRLQKRWLKSRLYWEGISAAVAQIQQEPMSTIKRLRLSTRVISKFLISPKRVIKLSLPTNNPDRFASQCLILKDIGYAMGMLGFVK